MGQGPPPSHKNWPPRTHGFNAGPLGGVGLGDGVHGRRTGRGIPVQGASSVRKVLPRLESNPDTGHGTTFWRHKTSHHSRLYR